jgi:hypothetical protein
MVPAKASQRTSQRFTNMSERKDKGSNARSGESRAVVVSREGAALRVERIELTPAAKKRLTTGVRSIGSLRNGQKKR